jgi:hypothetical protein
VGVEKVHDRNVFPVAMIAAVEFFLLNATERKFAPVRCRKTTYGASIWTKSNQSLAQRDKRRDEGANLVTLRGRQEMISGIVLYQTTSADTV